MLDRGPVFIMGHRRVKYHISRRRCSLKCEVRYQIRCALKHMKRSAPRGGARWSPALRAFSGACFVFRRTPIGPANNLSQSIAQDRGKEIALSLPLSPSLPLSFSLFIPPLSPSPSLPLSLSPCLSLFLSLY